MKFSFEMEIDELTEVLDRFADFMIENNVDLTISEVVEVEEV